MPQPKLVLDDVYGNDRPATDPTPSPAAAESLAAPQRTASPPSRGRSTSGPPPAVDTANPPDRDRDLLDAAATQLNVTIPDALFGATRRRAGDIGVPLRSVVVDALLAALELDLEAHDDRAHATHLAEYAVRMRRRNA